MSTWRGSRHGAPPPEPTRPMRACCVGCAVWAGWDGGTGSAHRSVALPTAPNGRARGVTPFTQRDVNKRKPLARGRRLLRSRATVPML